MILYFSSIIATFISIGGCGYLLWTMLLISRFARPASSPPTTSMPGVTILKPLHGAELGLLESLASFCNQNYPGPIQIIFGVQGPGDEALAAIQRLPILDGVDRIDVVVDTAMHGTNRKVSNLINMWPRVEHEIIVLADSDIRVDSHYIFRIVAALRERSVGAVTYLYHGVAASGVWSRLVALGINAHFLPNVILAVVAGLAHPCFGSTIALRRRTLAEIGGFIAVANCLADDYAIGAKLRALGYKVAVLPVTVGHVCEEASAAELWRHEVRWARTIRSIAPVGYMGLIVTHPFALALIGALAGIGVETFQPAIAIGLCIASLGCRLALLMLVERACCLPAQPYWLLPLCDLLSFAAFLSGIVGRNVNWRGRDYRFTTNGTLLAAHQRCGAPVCATSTRAPEGRHFARHDGAETGLPTTRSPTIGSL